MILDDSGYGIEPCFITPFENPTLGAEVNYNKLLKIERLIVERCFGQLKRRFPILQYICSVKLEYVQKIIVTCFVLHNIAKTLANPDIEPAKEASEENHEKKYIHFDNNNFDYYYHFYNNLRTIIMNYVYAIKDKKSEET